MNTTDQVREHLDDCLSPAIARAEVFAKQIKISPPELRRRLQAEGTSWADLLRDEIWSRVKQMRREGVSELDIAEALGYDEFKSYQRFVRKMSVRVAA